MSGHQPADPEPTKSGLEAVPDTSLATTGFLAGERGVEIFYQRRQPQTNLPRGVVVVAHGLGEHSDRYGHLFCRLVGEGYACYALDHRGFGRSGGQRGHVERFRDYLLDLGRLIHLARREHPETLLALYGHSMGGLIAIAYALEFGETIDLLVAASPAMVTPARAGRPLLLAIELLSRIVPTLGLDNRGRVPVSRDEEVLKALAADSLCTRRITARWVTEIIRTQTNVFNRAQELTVPVLIMQGGADGHVIPEKNEDFLQRVASVDKTFLLFPGYYHELHNELHSEVPLDELTAWLNRHMQATN